MGIFVNASNKKTKVKLVAHCFVSIFAPAYGNFLGINAAR